MVWTEINPPYKIREIIATKINWEEENSPPFSDVKKFGKTKVNIDIATKVIKAVETPCLIKFCSL